MPSPEQESNESQQKAAGGGFLEITKSFLGLRYSRQAPEGATNEEIPLQRTNFSQSESSQTAAASSSTLVEDASMQQVEENNPPRDGDNNSASRQQQESPPERPDKDIRAQLLREAALHNHGRRGGF